MLKLSAFLLAACAALPVHADWQLDNESSRLSFISTKATHITEVNRFRGLRGSVEDDGKVRLQVELETVETGNGKEEVGKVTGSYSAISIRKRIATPPRTFVMQMCPLPSLAT